MKIVFIGAGNLAFHLSKALQNGGFTIAQIYSRTKASAKELADALNTQYTTNVGSIVDDATVYIMSVSDSAIGQLTEHLTTLDGLVVHTAGSVDVNVFEGKIKNFGVIYPLQTFSKSRTVNFSEIPVFIEANSRDNLHTISKLANAISQKVFYASSDERLQLHLSAVFGCNFVNNLYNVSVQLARKARFDMSVLAPLILETAHKALASGNPEEVQTGPAARNDRDVMKKHIESLSDKPEWKELYKLLSDNIKKG